MKISKKQKRSKIAYLPTKIQNKRLKMKFWFSIFENPKKMTNFQKINFEAKKQLKSVFRQPKTCETALNTPI